MRRRRVVFAVLAAALAAGAAEPRWIAGAYVPPPEDATTAFFEPARHAIVEKAFAVCTGRVVRAVWRVAAPGMRDLYVNGTRVTPTALSPWTPYRHRILEEAFDVTMCVRPGEVNQLRAELGNGWYNPLPLLFWYRFNLRKALAVGTPCLRAVLEIDYADGARETVVTDETWRAREGRVVRNDLYLGVTEDARLDEREVGAARVVAGPGGRIVPAGDFPKTIVYNVRRAVSVTPRPAGAYLVDFGVNAAGTLRVKLRHTEAGQRIDFRHGERIFSDGAINPLSAVAGQIKNPARGPLYARAEPRDTLFCRAADAYVFEPRFTFHVFRYVQVEGLRTPPRPEDFEALDWSADVAEAGGFTSSSPQLNRLHDVCRRTFRANLQSVQSDCPGREKFGYAGDIACTAESFFCNYAMAPFYRKVVRDFLDEAAEDGLITETAPYVGLASNAAVPGTRAAPIGWAVGLPVLLDVMVRYAGERALLAEAYPTLTRYLDLLAHRYPTHRVPPCLGDWIAVSGEKADPALTGNAHYCQFARLTAKFARLLGKTSDAARYTRLAEAIASAWRADYYMGAGLVGRGVQGEQIFGLYHGLVPAADVPAAEARLGAALAARGTALTTGIFGTQYLLEYLSSRGRAEVAGRLVTHEGFPGWFHMLSRGATTLLEEWDEDQCADVYSNCHPMFGSCEQWFTRHVLGIAVADDAVGCDRVRIAPHAVGGLTSARGWLDTPHGRIAVSWRLVNGRLEVKKTIPPGITVLNATAR